MASPSKTPDTKTPDTRTPQQKAQQQRDRKAFSEVVAATVAATEPATGVAPGSIEHRRMLLIDYKRRTEEARVAQEQRLAKLIDAERRIERELQSLDRKSAAPSTPAPQAAAAPPPLPEPEPLPPPPEVPIEQRKKQVERIQRAYAEQAPKPADRATKPATGEAHGGVRRAPRFDIHAVVRFGKAPDDVIMRARNVSMTGALLATEKGVLPRFPVGAEHTAAVFLSEDPSERVSIQARVVRHEDNALVIDWSEDVEASFRIALLISTLPPES